MKAVLLTTTNSHLAGGLYNSVRGLGLALLNQKADVELLSFNDKYSAEDIKAYGNLPLRFYTISHLPLLNRLCYSSDLSKILGQIQPDIIHSQGIWLYNSKATRDYKRIHNNTKTIISPRGMLDPWALNNSSWKKKIAGCWFEYSNLKETDCIHVLCQSELESVREFGLKKPVAVIPNGIYLPELPSNRIDKEKKTLLFISRIHPKKGLPQLIEAINIIKQNNPSLLSQWEIKLAGWNQNGHQEEIESLVNKYKLNKYIKFIGPVLGQRKHEELTMADAFILPSFSEGLPMSILEAWAYKLPTVMTEYCNLPEGFFCNAAIKINTAPEDIAEGLTRLFCLSKDELLQMGENGYKLVSSKFTWDAIAKDTIKLYDFLVNGAEKPNFVFE